jgi:hypothetical protein
MINKLALVVAIGAASALLFAGSASAAPARHHHHKPKTFASCSASGEYAICDATGTANNPSSLWLHVRANPKQRVSGAWSLTCSEGDGAGGKSASFTGKTVLTRRMAMPYKHPSQCIVSADAQLSTTGNSIHVWLTIGN